MAQLPTSEKAEGEQPDEQFGDGGAAERPIAPRVECHPAILAMSLRMGGRERSEDDIGVCVCVRVL